MITSRLSKLLTYCTLAARTLYVAPEPEIATAPAEKRHRGTIQFAEVRKGTPVSRNEPCTCGSGKKFKKCCQ